MNVQPIGVFDSGVGGLTVLREIRALLPGEDLLYVADGAYAPYGDKPAAFVEARAVAITRFLLRHGAKSIVVACNTASGAALAALRAHFGVPVVGMEPGIKPAARLTRTGRIGVLATRGTSASEKFADLLRRFGSGVRVYVQPCPGLVERIEAGADAEVRTLLESYLAPLLRDDVDTLVLGCTHYPLLRPLIVEIAGPAVTIVDPAPAVARELRRRLAEGGLCAPADRRGTEKFWASGEPQIAKQTIARLWDIAVDGVRIAHFSEPPPAHLAVR